MDEGLQDARMIGEAGATRCFFGQAPPTLLGIRAFLFSLILLTGDGTLFAIVSAILLRIIWQFVISQRLIAAAL